MASDALSCRTMGSVRTQLGITWTGVTGGGVWPLYGVGILSTFWSSEEAIERVVHAANSALKEVGVRASSRERRHRSSGPTAVVS